MWGLIVLLGVSVVVFVGAMIMSFCATGRVKKSLTLAGMMF